WRFWKALLVWSAKRVISLAVIVSVIAAFTVDASSWLRIWSDYPLLVQPAFSCGFLIILALTPVWGRFFCECLCPLGIVQSFIARIASPRRAVRRVCTRLPDTRVQLAVRWSVFAVFAILIACGLGALAHLINPYSIVSKSMMALTGGNAVGNDASGVGNMLGVSSVESASVNAVVLCGLVMFALIVVSAFFGKGRVWCDWVCPFGSLFSVLSKKSLLGDKICRGCENCRKCFPRNDKNAEAETSKTTEVKEFEVSRRTAIKGVAVLAAAHTVEKTTDGGLASVSVPGVPSRPASIMPPGAVSRKIFNLKCVGCGLCVTRCPMNVLRQSVDLKTFGQPEMYFQNGYCRLSCDYKCAGACPTGALKPGTKERANLHLGHAIWKKDLCLRNADGDKREYCKACVRKCPVKALHLVDGAVVVDKSACVGCGACEHVCPVRPDPAIRVKGFDRQREVLPMAAGDLTAEMISCIERGDSCVLGKNGVIIARDKGRGIKPLLVFLDDGRLEGTIVADKIIGRAAAAICILGGAKEIHAKIMSEGAKELLNKYNIKADSAEIVKEIINRDKTGMCPMEIAVRDLSDPPAMVEAVRKTLKELTKK
ncbi:MAG: DUF1893 domain-containing protein, partial [Kiritimatiellae bacterium]|nr:DUF1893 domain-containing protein [Kiritimatiellia bacterium]